MKAVLLVEDLTFSRVLTGRIVQSVEPCTIFEAETGKQAFEAMRNHSDFDVIFADLSMPQTNGLELLKMVRAGQSPAPRNTPFIVISGLITEPVQNALDALDVSAAVAKPISKEILANALAGIGVDRPRLRTIDEYEAVPIAGLLEAGASDESRPMDPRDDFDAVVSFLEAAPILEGLDRKELELLAARVRTARYPENTVIDGEEFGETRLPVISWGEAEMLQSAELPDGEVVEHRVVLLEAGNLLGTFNFMSPPSDYKHPKVRTTRSTEVVILDFEDDDPNSELSAIRDKVKLAIGKILSQRITYSDKALAISLTNQLADTRRKRSAGGYIIMILILLSVYALIMRTLLDANLTGAARTIISVGLILISMMPFMIILKIGTFKAADLGLTFKGARTATIEAVIASSIFIGVLVGLKFFVVTLIPTYHDYSMFGTSGEFTRFLPDGRIDWTFYGFNVLVYALLVPAQEIIARCGIQSLLVEFLYGSNTQRAILAILVSNFVFSATHAHLNVGFALATFVGGLFFGWIFYRNRSIVGVSVAHLMIGATAIFALRLEEFLM